MSLVSSEMEREEYLRSSDFNSWFQIILHVFWIFMQQIIKAWIAKGKFKHCVGQLHLHSYFNLF